MFLYFVKCQVRNSCEVQKVSLDFPFILVNSHSLKIANQYPGYLLKNEHEIKFTDKLGFEYFTLILNLRNLSFR